MIFSKKESPHLVAGPCSVESREQLREVTLQLRNMNNVSLIRGGVWKPRTRPGGFEGLGEPALIWMDELQRELGVRYCCEVARPEQVELCLQHGIEAMWIGARTTANPFMVSELCAALRGSGVTVLVKNPVCPDASLWIGAVERLREVGIEQIAIVHRGFALYHNQGYRNAPVWEVVMQIRQELPEVPLLCDPSHIGGRRDLVAPIAHIAMQMDFDGLMVEVHPHPNQALTDAPQQITPAELQQLVADLPRVHTTNPAPPDPALMAMRAKIDEVDSHMIRLMAQRMELSRHIADLKRQGQMSVYQSARWKAVLTDRLQQANRLGLDSNFVKEMFEKIHAESVRIQLFDESPSNTQ